MNASLYRQIRQRGFRLTRTRKALIRLLSESQRALSVIDLKEALAFHDLKPHKTTLYRELDFLCQQGYVEEIALPGRSRHYEWNAGDHHHHLICRSCDRVEDVSLERSEATLSLAERRLQRQNRFSDVRHQLSFYGLCATCT